MFDKLIDVALQFIGLFRPWFVMDEFERGVVLRTGRFNRELGPGFHFIIPFNYEVVWHDNVVPTTTALDSQSLTTSDGVPIVATGVLTWEITDIRTFLLGVEGRESVLLDAAYGCVSSMVSTRDWENVMQSEQFAHEITKAIRRRAKKFGVNVIEFQFKDLAKSRPYRLISNTPVYDEWP